MQRSRWNSLRFYGAWTQTGADGWESYVEVASTPVLGAELIPDPGFTDAGNWAGAGSGANWTAAGGIITGVLATGTQYSTTSCIPANILIKVGFDLKTRTNGDAGIRLNSVANACVTSTPGDNYRGYLFSDTVARSIGITTSAGNFSGTCDNITAKQVSLSSLLAPTRPFSGSGRFYTTATDTNCATGEWLGTAAYVDDVRNPTKGVFAYVNRTSGVAGLRVLTAANTWTSLISTAITYVSGQVFYLDYNAATKVGKIFYNGVQIGANQDLSAYTWINQNRKHAIFSTTSVTPSSVVYSYVQQ